MFHNKSFKTTSFSRLSIFLFIAVFFAITLRTTLSNAAVPEKKVAHHTEKIREGKSFSKIYTLSTKKAGILEVRIHATGIGSSLKITLCGSSSKYNLKNKNIPVKELKADNKGKIYGQIKIDHIVMADSYKVIIQNKGAVKKDGTLKTDITFTPAKIEEKTYQDLNNNDTPSDAKDFNITNHKVHRRILSGFDEQCDYADYDKFYIDKDTYLSLRLKTLSNKRKEKYHVRLVRYWDNAVFTEIDNPKHKQITKLLHLTPGYYFLQISSSDGPLFKDNQIIYSLYMAKTVNISSLAMSKQNLRLYNLQGNNQKALVSKCNGKSVSKYDVAFRSSNPSVASVSQSGKVTAKASGKATITCYAIDKPSVKATCKVTVKKPSLKVSVASRKIFIGNSTRCSLKRSPKKLKVTWKSSHPSVATVNAKGNVTGRSVGKTKIYAISREGIKSNACIITVHRKPKPKKPDDTTTEPGNKDDRTDKIAPVLSLSSAHLSPKGTITVTANVSGGTFSARGAISIKTKFGKSCVIRATAARGSGTILYQVNGKSASKSIVIY